MTELRAILADLGYDEVRTHLQSGNAIFRAEASERDIELALSAAVADRFGLEVAVIVRSDTELSSIIAANPFRAGSVDPTACWRRACPTGRRCWACR